MKTHNSIIPPHYIGEATNCRSMELYAKKAVIHRYDGTSATVECDTKGLPGDFFLLASKLELMIAERAKR